MLAFDFVTRYNLCPTLIRFLREPLDCARHQYLLKRRRGMVSNRFREFGSGLEIIVGGFLLDVVRSRLLFYITIITVHNDRPLQNSEPIVVMYTKRII